MRWLIGLDSILIVLFHVVISQFLALRDHMTSVMVVSTSDWMLRSANSPPNTQTIANENLTNIQNQRNLSVEAEFDKYDGKIEKKKKRPENLKSELGLVKNWI